MTGVPVVFRDERERVLASYDYTNLVSGQGILSYFLTQSKETTNNSFSLRQNAFMTPTTNGLLSVSGTDYYDFSTGAFNVSRTTKGSTIFSGWANWTSGTMTITATIYHDKGTIAEAGIGTMDWSDLTVDEASNSVFVLEKEESIGDYVHQAEYAMRHQSGNGTAYGYIIYLYADGTTVQTSTDTTQSTEDVTFTHENTLKTKKVSSVQLWAKKSAGGDSGYVDDLKIYAENVTGAPTAITSAIKSQDITSDTGFNIDLPLTETNILPGDALTLEIKIVGGVGGFVIDPTGKHENVGSMKLDMPFKIII